MIFEMFKMYIEITRRSIANFIVSVIKLLLKNIEILNKTKRLIYKLTLSIFPGNKKTSFVQCLWKRSGSKKVHKSFS